MGGREPSQVMLQRCGWNQTVARHVARIYPCDPTVDQETYYRDGVISGAFTAHAVIVDGAHKATVLSSIHDGGKGLEWCLEAAGSEDDSMRLTSLAMTGIEKLARQAGCEVIRFQTHRPGLVEQAARLGYQMDEVILRKAL